VITPRTTRLIRVPDLRTFRTILASLAREGTQFDARDRFIIVPTHAAAAHLVRSIENRLDPLHTAVILPELITPGELTTRVAERLASVQPLLTGAEREALLGVACRSAAADGHAPPFRLRPGLVAEVLRFYDALRRNQKDVATFERLALGVLEPGAASDRGAERLVRQTRFLASAFRHFERLCAGSGGVDEHVLRAEAITTAAPQPWRHAVVAVGDRSRDPSGLMPADWDVLSRIPGLDRIDVVVTNTALAGAFHERIHQLLPGITEVHVEADGGASPVLLVPRSGALAHLARDREEEVAGFARWVKQTARTRPGTELDRMALVFRQPLPYVYVAREVLRSAGIPCQMFDALPLAAEPYAAALDLVFSFVSSNFARVPSIALLRSPHLRVTTGPAANEHRRITGNEIAALDRALSDAGYLGDLETLHRILTGWENERLDRRAGDGLEQLARELQPLRTPAPVADHLTRLMTFFAAHENVPGPDDPLRARQLRARSAILATLGSLRDAYLRFDPEPVEFEVVAATVRRWIEGQTFAPRTGDRGVHLVDAESARFGDFDRVQLAGLVDGEWPDRPRRNIFYSPGILRELGWPAESDRLDAARAAFSDLMNLAEADVLVSGFMLEDDAIVAPSTLLDEVETARLDAVEWQADRTRIFEHEALGIEPVVTDALLPLARHAARFREHAPSATDPRHRGSTSGHRPAALSLGALERYQDCPFKFFAADVLRLEETPEDEPTLSAKARGRFVHEVFQRFFEAWDRRGAATITSDRIDAARALFEETAAPLLARLPEAEAALERARLFGSAIAVGMVDVVLGLEASRPQHVRERWLEHRFEGEFSFGSPEGRRARVRGVADRVDLLDGNRLRVVDYKSGYAPDIKRALQVPIYALCAQETLAGRGAGDWAIDDASYVAFSGKRTLAAVVKEGSESAAVLAAARERLFALLDGIGTGEFPPRPHEPRLCGYCAYPSVCRKDYVGDE
jgi:RecB family exonuclease